VRHGACYDELSSMDGTARRLKRVLDCIVEVDPNPKTGMIRFFQDASAWRPPDRVEGDR